MREIEQWIEELRQRRRNVQPKELFQLLEAAGFERRTGKGSHTIYTHPRYRLNVSIPSQKPLKPTYVKLATQAVEAVLDNDEDS